MSIIEATATYSEEGVPKLRQLLSNPGPGIRESAVEGMKQLGLPGAAAVEKIKPISSERARLCRRALLVNGSQALLS